MQSELLRALLLEYLKAAHNQNDLTFGSCFSGVAILAEQRCPEQLAEVQGATYALRGEDRNRLKHVVWDLILERVLIPGRKVPPNTTVELNDGWPFLSLTDHGQKVVKAANPVPYDPDGYLARLERTTGGLHPTVKAYLAESLSALRTGNRLSAAVMLGAASEMVFLELCSAISTAIANSADRKRFEVRTAPKKKMVDRVSAVNDWLTQKKGQLPTDWQRQEQIGLVNKVADLIRNRRNDAGHPQDPPGVLAHEEMYGLLVLFPHYCQKLYELKRWLSQNAGTIV
jgi:hypothetical protein